MSKPPAFIKDAIAAAPETPSQDKLIKLREKAAAVRDDLLELENFKTKVETVEARIHKARHEELPDLMDELKIPRIDLEAEGNYPAYSVVAKPFYRANIAADWPIEKKAKAYKALDDAGSGDLLKTQVAVVFARGPEEKARAKTLLDLLRKAGFTPEVTQSVPHTTLTAWLKEQLTAGHKVDLATFGAHVGRVVDLKPLKEK